MKAIYILYSFGLPHDSSIPFDPLDLFIYFLYMFIYFYVASFHWMVTSMSRQMWAGIV